MKYQSEKDAKYFEKLKTNYSLIQALSEDLKGSIADVTPIFILGMPRSGTTLVEQIVSSHSQVRGAGELDYALTFGDSIATGESKISKESLLKFRENYLSHLKPLSGNSPMVTDKTPFNFRYIGLILTAIPEAKIVHVTRDPAAICWGNFKQLFASNQLSYSYDLKDTVKYYSMYKDLMEFWQEHHAESIFNLDYELLTTNQEDQTRQLIRHIGLDWEDVCLAPESNDRAVLTLSNTQVRQKVYQGSSEQWKKYEPFLKGAFDGLK